MWGCEWLADEGERDGETERQQTQTESASRSEDCRSDLREREREDRAHKPTVDVRTARASFRMSAISVISARDSVRALPLVRSVLCPREASLGVVARSALLCWSSAISTEASLIPPFPTLSVISSAREEGGCAFFSSMSGDRCGVVPRSRPIASSDGGESGAASCAMAITASRQELANFNFEVSISSNFWLSEFLQFSFIIRRRKASKWSAGHQVSFSPARLVFAGQ